MFKCCVCNSASKNAENVDDTPVGSPRLSVKGDDEIKSATIVDRLNGNVQKSEKTSLLEDEDVSPEDKNVSLEDKIVSLEDKNASLEDKITSLEDKNALLEDKDASPEVKDALLEDKNSLLEDKNASPEDKNILLEDKDVSLEDKDASLEDALLEDKNVLLEDKDTLPEDKYASLEDRNVLLEDKDASLEDENVLLEDKNASLDSTPVPLRAFSISQNENTDVEESSSSTSTKETVEEAGEETDVRIVDNKDDSNLEITEGWMEDVDSIGAVGPVKTNLYDDASGYIERTINDGPEDEGDDSVFEDENKIKKALPGTSGSHDPRVSVNHKSPTSDALHIGLSTLIYLDFSIYNFPFRRLTFVFHNIAFIKFKH